MNQKKTDHPRICANCIHYQLGRCCMTAFHFSPNHPACPRFIPKPKDTK